MDIQTQELKHKLRTAWKSYKALLGGVNSGSDSDAITLAYTLINGHMWPINNDNICDGEKKMDCLEALRGCVNGTTVDATNGKENYEKCKKFVESSTFISNLHAQLSDKEFRKADGANDKFNGKGNSVNALKDSNYDLFKVNNANEVGERATNEKMIKNILFSIGFSDDMLSKIEVDTLLGKEEIDDLFRDYLIRVIISFGNIARKGHPTVAGTAGDFSLANPVADPGAYGDGEHTKYTAGPTDGPTANKHDYDYLKTLELKDLKTKLEGKVELNDKMVNIVKYLMKVYNTYNVSTVEEYEKAYEQGLIPKSHINFTEHSGVTLFGNFMSNPDVLNATSIKKYLNIAADDLKTRATLVSFLMPGAMTGGSNGLSRNNIYSSINFNQSGGDNLPATAGRIRNVLTRWVSGGLISLNIRKLLEIVQNFLEKNGKGFDKGDLNNIKAGLERLSVYEYDLLKLLVYINSLLQERDVGLNINERDLKKYSLTGGSKNLFSTKTEELLKKLHTKSEDEVKNIMTMITSLQGTINDIKANLTGNVVKNFNMFAKDKVLANPNTFGDGNTFVNVEVDADGKLQFTGATV